jgi:hypothetical protein
MASNTIMQRLGSNFGTTSGIGAQPDSMTRYFGGQNRQSHPYVSGYWQLFINPPVTIFGGNAPIAAEWFHATAEGFTPPTRTLNKADLPGQGGLGSSFITGQTLTRSFSITFREYRNLPMMNLFQQWTSVIDPYVGVSELPGVSWQASSYKGSAYVILTKPVGAYAGNGVLTKNDFEEVYYFQGIFPENAPTDSLASDISANDVVQYNISFSFDGWPLTHVDTGVADQATALMATSNYMATYDTYLATTSSVITPTISGINGAQIS